MTSAGGVVTRRFVAPGKLMIAGEYSVLAPGGEALAVAVEGGVALDAEPAPAWELVRADSGAAWRPGAPVPGDLRFAAAAFEEVRAHLGDPGAPHRLVLRPAGAHGTGEAKPGIGGSASATAVTAAAVLTLATGVAPVNPLLLDVALRAHRRAQDGEGSGYDVATVVYGGLVHWRHGEATRLPWPDGLHLLAGYSGTSARTTSFLAKVEALRAADPARLADDFGALAAPVRALVDAFRTAAPAAALDAARACHRALAAWDAAHRLGIVTPAIAQLCAAAERAGAAAKVSGAGGGDSVIAFAGAAAVLEAVSRAWTSAGFRPLPLVRAEAGTREA